MKKIFFVILVAFSLAGTAFATEATKFDKNANSLKNNIASSFKSLDQKELLNEENQLPVQAKRSFSKMFEGYTIKQAIRFTGNDGEGFYISAENEMESLIIKIDDDLQISIFKQIKK